MKKILVFLLVLLGLTKISNSITIPIYGKAGIEVNSNGEIKICPGFALYRCASVTVNWNDVVDFFNNLTKDFPPEASVKIINEVGEVISIRTLQITHISEIHRTDSPPEALKGDNLIFK